jgi:hypothetical protein
MKSSLHSLIPFLQFLLNHLRLPSQKTQVKVTLRLTVGRSVGQSVSQSVSQSWCRAPIWGSWPYIYCCLIVTVLLLWGALSDERSKDSLISSRYIDSGLPQQKTPFRSLSQPYLNCCLLNCCRGNVFTDTLPRSECLLLLYYSGFQYGLNNFRTRYRYIWFHVTRHLYPISFLTSSLIILYNVRVLDRFWTPVVQCFSTEDAVQIVNSFITIFTHT